MGINSYLDYVTMSSQPIVPLQLFYKGKVNNKDAIRDLIKQARKEKLSRLEMFQLTRIRDRLLLKKDFFGATCLAQLIIAWQVEFAGYVSVSMGQLDLILTKYFS